MLARMPRRLAFFGDVAHQAAQRRLRRIIGDEPRAGTKAGDRRDEDDRRTRSSDAALCGNTASARVRLTAKVVVPFLGVDAVEAERADPDADIEHHAVEAAEAVHRLFDHPVHIGLARDIRLDGKGATALTVNLSHSSSALARFMSATATCALSLANTSDIARPLPTGSVSASKVRCPPPTTRMRRPASRARPGASPLEFCARFANVTYLV